MRGHAKKKGSGQGESRGKPPSRDAGDRGETEQPHLGRPKHTRDLISKALEDRVG